MYIPVRYTSVGLTVPNTSLAATLSLVFVFIDFRVPWYTYFLVPEAVRAASIPIPTVLSGFSVRGRPLEPTR